MALSYPISTPTTIGIESITIRPFNATAKTSSPFSYQEQVYSWGGQAWSAEVTIPAVKRDLSAEWVSFLVSLKGQEGTFLLGDPNYAEPRGTATSVSVSGSLASDTITVGSINGTLLKGDYIQLGGGSSAKLHMVLEDISGTGTYNVWPNLRSTYSSEAGVLSSPKGVFRLDQSNQEWGIDSNSQYALSFSAREVIT